MRRRGRQFLTQSFIWLTGIVAITLVAGSVYFLLEPSLAHKRLFAIPLLAISSDIAFRFLKSADVGAKIDRVLQVLTIPFRKFR